MSSLRRLLKCFRGLSLRSQPTKAALSTALRSSSRASSAAMSCVEVRRKVLGAREISRLSSFVGRPEPHLWSWQWPNKCRRALQSSSRIEAQLWLQSPTGTHTPPPPPPPPPPPHRPHPHPHAHARVPRPHMRARTHARTHAHTHTQTKHKNKQTNKHTHTHTTRLLTYLLSFFCALLRAIDLFLNHTPNSRGEDGQPGQPSGSTVGFYS